MASCTPMKEVPPVKKPKKKLLISLVALILVAAIGVGICFSTRSSG